MAHQILAPMGRRHLLLLYPIRFNSPPILHGVFAELFECVYFNCYYSVTQSFLLTVNFIPGRFATSPLSSEILRLN